MKRKVLSLLTALFAVGLGYAAMRPTPEYLKSAVVYQIVLRTFTREGTFKAATEMLDHVRSAGVDVVYLAPFVEMDRDMDQRFRLPRVGPVPHDCKQQLVKAKKGKTKL
jgi:pullulanase/glycogen debranching enzyme